MQSQAIRHLTAKDAVTDYAISSCKSISNVSMIPVSTKRSLPFLIPPFLLDKPITSQELSNTCVVGLLLRRFERNKLVEVLINRCRITRAAVR